MTRELIELEVMNADQLQTILDQHKLHPQIKPGTHAIPSAEPGTTNESAPRLDGHGTGGTSAEGS